jgi:alpha-galactosidase/6-phospho-beta-glucosidase family protein
MANPLVREWDRAEPLLEALLEANWGWLPRFAGAPSSTAVR